MSRRFLALLLAGILALGLAACKKEPAGEVPSSSSEPEADPNWPVEAGEVRLREKPGSVVSLSPALTEVICELGYEGQLSGVSDFCDYPDEVNDLDRCGTSQLPDLDAIKALRPQVVFSSSPLTQEATVKLQQLEAEVVVLPRADSVEGIGEIYLTVATLLGGAVDGDQNGRDTFAPYRELYDALCYAADGIADRVSGIYLRLPPLVMATGDSFEGELLEKIGVKNDAGEFTGWQYPQEKAVDLYPDIIFYDSSISNDYGENYLQETQIYNTTDAVKQGRCYPVDGSAFERQSGRLFDALEGMFSDAYPDVPVELGMGGSDGDGKGDPEGGTGEQESPGEDGEMLDLSDATQVN